MVKKSSGKNKGSKKPKKPAISGKKQEAIRDEKGRFITGVSGNPLGKPKGLKKKKFLDELEEMLDEVAEGKGITYRNALRKKMLKRMIIDGDTTLLKEYWQQRDGKPKQQVDSRNINLNITHKVENKKAQEIAKKYEEELRDSLINNKK